MLLMDGNKIWMMSIHEMLFEESLLYKIRAMDRRTSLWKGIMNRER